jgi:endonuclease G
MKKLTLITVLLFILALSYGQDTVRIIHANYTTVFSKSNHYPVLVSWWLTKAKVSCATPLKRNNTFCADPLLPTETDLSKDYLKSGYDKGHNCPCDDNLCQSDQVERECFYFSNMAPQFHKFNAGSWERLETTCRNIAKQYDSIHIWCGSIGIAKKIGRVSVPVQMWKVVYIKSQKAYKAYLFNNSIDDSGNKTPEVPLNQIEKLTNFKFN